MDWERIGEVLASKVSGQVKINEPLKNHTTWKIGGPADLLLLPQRKEDVLSALNFAASEGIPVHILGNGSNVLVGDGGMRGLVIKMAGSYNKVTIQDEEITAQAGALLPALAQKACQHDLKGLEGLGGIPGTVGGAVIMNAGAYGGTIGELVQGIEVCDLIGGLQKLSASALEFGYRHSSLKDSGLIILEVVLKLKKGKKEEIKKVLQENLRHRRLHQPLNLPNAGSIFVNPPGYAAGYLVEKAGLKGLKIGGAQVSEKHANFIVNTGNATAQDVLALIREVQRRVAEAFGVTLETEIKLLGEE